MPVMGTANLCIRLCERMYPMCRVTSSLLENQARALVCCPSALLEYMYSHSHSLNGGDRGQMRDAIRKILYMS